MFVEPGAFMNMFFGVGILKVKGLFRKLRKLALRYGGVVAFFDEADALGNRGGAVGGDGGAFRSERFAAFLHDATEPGSSYPYLSPGAQRALQEAAQGGYDRAGSLGAYGGDPWTGPRRESIMMMGGGGGGMGTLQALLAELSGLKKPRGFFNRIVRKMLGMRPKPPPKYRMLVMMASNLPEALDPAMLRPGRIDRIYKVGYPTQEGRKRTYEGYLDKVDHVLTDDDIEKLATITPYATGATIKDMVNEALITAIRDGRRVITWADMIKAKQLKEHGLADDFDYVEHERHALAIHEACHAVALHRVSRHRNDRSGHYRAPGPGGRLRVAHPARGPLHPLALGVRGRPGGVAGVAGRRADVLRRRQLVGGGRRSAQRHPSGRHDVRLLGHG